LAELGQLDSPASTEHNDNHDQPVENQGIQGKQRKQPLLRTPDRYTAGQLCQGGKDALTHPSSHIRRLPIGKGDRLGRTPRQQAGQVQSSSAPLDDTQAL
jgi:hypothetical protein